MTTKLLAYHGKQEIKDKYKNKMLEDIVLGNLIQGTSYEDGKGCFIGCTLHSYDHACFPKELGVPEELAHLSDAIFEGLSKKDAIQFSKDWHDQIRVGADLSLVWPRFVIAILSDEKMGVLQFVKNNEFVTQKKAIEDVTLLYKEWTTTNTKPTQDRWEAARDAAWDAVWAAGAAGDAGDARAAAWAAWDAAWDAVWAAGDAAGAAAGAAAGDAQWLWMRDKLFELLADAK